MTIIPFKRKEKPMKKKSVKRSRDQLSKDMDKHSRKIRNETTSKAVASKAGWYAQVASGNLATCIKKLKHGIKVNKMYGTPASQENVLQGNLIIKFLEAGKSLAASCNTQAPDRKTKKKK